MATVTFFGSVQAPAIAASPPMSFDSQAEYQWQEALAAPPDGQQQQWALLQFDRPVSCPPACRYIASRLDTDLRTALSDTNLASVWDKPKRARQRSHTHERMTAESKQCRLAFHGTLLHHYTDAAYITTALPALKVIKFKYRSGTVERAQDTHQVIVRNLFKRETNLDVFLNMPVRTTTGLFPCHPRPRSVDAKLTFIIAYFSSCLE